MIFVEINYNSIGYVTGARCNPRSKEIVELQFISADKQSKWMLKGTYVIIGEPTRTLCPALSAGLTARRDWSAGLHSLRQGPSGPTLLQFTSLHLSSRDVQAPCLMADDGLSMFPFSVKFVA